MVVEDKTCVVESNSGVLERFRTWISGKLPWGDPGFPKAFEGDTYVADLHKAAKAKKPWVKVLVAGVFLSACADWYLLSDTLNMALEDGVMILGVIPLFSGFIALALLVAYLLLGFIAGKNFREFNAFKNRSSVTAGVLLAAVELFVLVFLFFLRLYGEIEKNGGFGGGALADFGFGGGTSSFQIGGGSSSGLFTEFFDKVVELGPDVLFPALALSLIMLVGALLEICYAYLSYDPYSGEKKKLAEAYVAEDRQLYEKVFFEEAFSLDKCAEYERAERELDKRAVSSVFRINSLIAQLNSIVDPADAHDFRMVSQLLGKEFSKR